MNAEFNWWLLIVGLVVGAGMVWLVVLDARRHDDEVDVRERSREALWLSSAMTDEGHTVSAAVAARMLDLHRAYLDGPPPDDPTDEPDPADLLEATQDRPSSTGGAAMSAEPAATSDTPKVADESSPATAGDGPTQ